jgi:hypothetical protein
MFWKGLAGAAVVLNLAAFSSSSNYQLKSYGVNSGGTNSSSSSTYSLQAGTGEVSGNVSGGATYRVKSGSVEAQQANVPGAPTLSNGSNTYTNKLDFIINTSANPTDTTYAVAVSTTSNFTVTNYVQADGTLGATQVWQTYALWGGSSGSSAIGLAQSTTYYFKVAAMQGKFTATAFGPSANAATSASAALSFSVTPNSMNMGDLPAGSVIDSPSNISFTFSSNSAFGGTVYIAGSDTGLRSAAASHTIQISPPSGDLSSLSEGFGLQGLSASSPLSVLSPYNGSGNVVGAVYTSFQPVFAATSTISSGTASAVLKARASATTPAAKDYTTTLTFVAAASY